MRTRNGRICEQDCQDRSPTCHGTCEKYLAFHNTRKEENEKRVQAKEIDYLTNDSIKRTKAGRYNKLSQYRPKNGG